jgi:hypothetical protein
MICTDFSSRLRVKEKYKALATLRAGLTLIQTTLATLPRLLIFIYRKAAKILLISRGDFV